MFIFGNPEKETDQTRRRWLAAMAAAASARNGGREPIS